MIWRGYPALVYCILMALNLVSPLICLHGVVSESTVVSRSFRIVIRPKNYLGNEQ